MAWHAEPTTGPGYANTAQPPGGGMPANTTCNLLSAFHSLSIKATGIPAVPGTGGEVKSGLASPPARKEAEEEAAEDGPGIEGEPEPAPAPAEAAPKAAGRRHPAPPTAVNN